MEYEKAVTAFSDVIRIDDKNTQAYIGLADAYSGMGEWSKSADNYDNALLTVKEKAGLPVDPEEGAQLWAESGFDRDDLLDKSGLSHHNDISDDDLIVVAVFTYPDQNYPEGIEFGPYDIEDIVVSPDDVLDVVDKKYD